MQLYTANETADQNVWFDDFKVTFTPQLIVQENHYYPFGLELAGISKENKPQHKFTYNSKEKQSEFGLNWLSYGQREHDPALGRFNRIDRFAEKYYDLNPYQYGANNPIRYIDINGDSLWISFKTGFLGLGKRRRVLYQNGQLLKANGDRYEGKGVKVEDDGSITIKNSFLKKTVAALQRIGTTVEGGRLINELQGSDNHFTIYHASNNKNKSGRNEFIRDNNAKAHAHQLRTDPGAANQLAALQRLGVDLNGGSGGDVYWNPSGTELFTTAGPRRNATMTLAHEMFHGLDANRGLFDSRIHLGVRRIEWQAVYRTNLVRNELGLALRTHYIRRRLANGTFVPAGPRMLTPTNLPLRPAWYVR